MFELDTLSTLVAATLVLLLGRKLVQSVSLLKKYTIPEPVAGGLLVAVALLVLKKSVGWEVNFDMTLRDPLMLAFFATIGLNANLASLRKGGRVVGVFLVVVVGLLLMQNAIGIGMASLLGLDPLMGLIAGSITLSGGHGTGAAWSKLFVERYGFASATEVAMACATFGLALVGFYRVFERAVSVLGNVSLSLFLAMALMSLKLWELASLALPMLAILVVQTIFMALYAIFVTWRMMGKNYDAAVLAAGHCGFGLGATPTAIANMQAITDRFGPSHMAFLVVPMVGAFFIDIVNALVIKLYLMLPMFAG
ncbi:TPA: sodium/glutamate symporter [Salmonella enterica subsp. enterica serovar Typhimurium]